MGCLLFTHCVPCSEGKFIGSTRCCVGVSPTVLTEGEVDMVPEDMREKTDTGFFVLKLKDGNCPYYAENGCSLSNEKRFLECKLFPIVPYDDKHVLLYHRCPVIKSVVVSDEYISGLIEAAKKLLGCAHIDWIKAVRKLNKVDDYEVKILVRVL